MRAVHASSTAAKHGITQASATAPTTAAGPKGADAFKALVQALADSAPTDQGGQGSADTGAPTTDSAQTPAATAAVPAQVDGAMTPAALTPPVTTKTAGKTAKDLSGDDPTTSTSATAVDSGNQTLSAEMAALALLAPTAIAPPASTATTTTPPPAGAATDSVAPLAASPAGSVAPAAGKTSPNDLPFAGAADADAGVQSPGIDPTNTDLAKQSQAQAQAQPAVAPNPTAGAPLADGATTFLFNPSSTPMPAGFKLPQSAMAKPAPKSAQPSIPSTGSSEPSQTGATTAIDTTGVAQARGIGAPTNAEGLPTTPTHAGKANMTNASSSQSNAHGSDAEAPPTAPGAITTASIVNAPSTQPATADTTFANSLSGAPADATAATPSSGGSAAIAGSAALNTGAADPQSLAVLPRSTALAASAVAQVNVVLQRAGLSRAADSLTIQLDPAELGRVEVKLKMTKDAPVSATVTADRPQTLEMLRNDKGALERALQSAGLSTNSGSLSFNLRSDGGSGQQTNFGQPRNGGQAADGSASSITQTLDVVAAPNGWTAAGHLDLRV